MSHYDYIFLGAGCAGLSLATRMAKAGLFTGKRVLLIDKSRHDKNDRTWCFWETGSGFFEPIVYRTWNRLDFFSTGWSQEMDIRPYQYKMIRGIDFYRYCLEELSRHPRIDWLREDVKEVTQDKTDTVIRLHDRTIMAEGAILFNSIYSPPHDRDNRLRLLQHFKGWVIKTEKDVFDPARATMMDFRVSQDKGTTFSYLLPFDTRTALIEYTLFTKQLLAPAEYDEGLRHYIKQQLGIDSYTVSEEEFGVIPMTNEKFAFHSNGMYHIGTAGGQTKASSGYTFQFIQKLTAQITDHLISGRSLDKIAATPRRFRFYDNTLLHILYYNKLKGSDIFTTLFKKNKPQQVLRFLDNESSVGEELKLIASLPAWPFFLAALSGVEGSRRKIIDPGPSA